MKSEGRIIQTPGCAHGRPIRVPAFVSCNHPKAHADIDGHENNERRAHTQRHFSATLVDVCFRQ